MATKGVSRQDSAAQTTLELIEDLVGAYRPRNFAVRLWDGTTWGPGAGESARFTLVLQHPGSARRIFKRPTELNMAECYLNNDFDIEGEVEAVLPLVYWLRQRPRSVWDKLRAVTYLLRLPTGKDVRSNGADRDASVSTGTKHSVARDKQAVSHHYDVSNTFYSMWLDRRMVYSCALFSSEDDDLDRAQELKIEYVCRKLRLKPGERLLDIGCGWGALIIHAAEHYDVDAVGVTLSQAQADLANERIRSAGVTERCSVEVCDYRDLDEPGGFDKLVSVGMAEHVGVKHLAEYFAKAWELLKPGGVFLNHCICDLPGRPSKERPGFVDTYVFPDGEAALISCVLEAAEGQRFEVRDLESLREHYPLTLRHWTRNLEACKDRAIREVGVKTYRIWRLYTAGAAARFDMGHLGVYQALLLKSDQGRSGLPLERGDWYP